MITRVAHLDGGERASHAARSVTTTLAAAEALADRIRDAGFPARVVVGRKRGWIRLKAAGTRGVTRPGWARPVLIAATRHAALAWLSYTNTPI